MSSVGRNLTALALATLLSSPAAAQRLDPDPDRLNDGGRLWAGHRAFAAGRYDDALAYYRAAVRRGTGFATLPSLIEIVERRRALGRVAPADTHQVMVIWVDSIVTEGRGAREDVTAQIRRDWRGYLAMLPGLIEGLSGGGWTLNIRDTSVIATAPAGSPLKGGNPDHLGLGPWFFATSDEVDTYITISQTNSPNFGLARRYPFVEGVLYGPHRGMMELGGTPSLVTMVHEFFHTVEWSSAALPPAHSFEQSREAELAYYRRHFAQTLPVGGWARLNHRTQWHSSPANSAAALERIRAAYATISLADRQEARRLAAAGRHEEALAKSPYEVTALRPLIAAYRRANRDASALEARLAEADSVSGFVGPQRPFANRARSDTVPGFPYRRRSPFRPHGPRLFHELM